MAQINDGTLDPSENYAQPHPSNTEQLRTAVIKLFDDLFTVNYHPTDTDACGLHEKHTSQCYGCRHAKWSNIIKEELQQRLDSLTVVDELTKMLATHTADAVRAARIDELNYHFKPHGANQLETLHYLPDKKLSVWGTSDARAAYDYRLAQLNNPKGDV